MTGTDEDWGEPAYLEQLADRWLVICGHCDGMLPMACECPEGDPRQDIWTLVHDLRRYVDEVARLRRVHREWGILMDRLITGLETREVPLKLGQSYIDVALAEIDRLRRPRCWSCEHEIRFHHQDGCWFTIGAGKGNLVCPCAVPRIVEEG